MSPSFPIKFASGTWLQYCQVRWADLYESVLRILNGASNAHTVVPFGDPMYGQPNATTFTGARYHASGLAPTWTWSEAPSGFDTPLDLTKSSSWKGIIPTLKFNGTDERFTTPDDNFWTPSDLSMGVWVQAFGGNNQFWLSKYTSGANTEFIFGNGSGGGGANTPSFNIYDAENDTIGRYYTVAMTTGSWYFIVATLTGTTIKVYQNGTQVDNADNNAGSFGSRPNGTAKMIIGSDDVGAGRSFCVDRLAGGPMGPFFVQAQLTAAQVKNLYEIGRRALGLM